MRNVLAVVLLSAVALPALGQAKAVERPFLLWTKEEAAALKKRIETDPGAKAQYERMTTTDFGKGHPTLLNLFNYMAMGDKQAGEREKAQLLQFIGHKPEPLTWDRDPKTMVWNEGMPSSGDRHQRDEQTLNVLRYDVLYHELTPEQRTGIEKAFKSYIQFHLDGAPPRHPAFKYDRASWLPNMHWPRAIGTHIMAVALADEDLIKAMFNSDGGFKWFLDEYIADGQFYMEEFNKYYSNIGSMLMYCEGLEKLGLGQYGYGYTGKPATPGKAGGATMRKYLHMNIALAYPRTDVPGGLANYRTITMGDTRGGYGPFEAAVVNGYNRFGKGGDRYYSTAHMNGPLPKLGEPFWYEVAHKRWPQDHFDYILAQMRRPGDDLYLPSLYWGLGPIDPKKVTPPTVQSYVTDERGFAFLRMEESPKYWESPAPAVAMQFGMYYVHYVHDCFTLLGYQAFNRPIYINKGNAAKGYAGGDPWRDHLRGHTGVFVDGQRANPVDRGNNGCENQTIRHGFHDDAKFVSCRARGVYPDIDQQRALILTDDYLFDVFRLVDVGQRKSHVYDWRVQTLGYPTDEQGFKPVADTGEKSATAAGTIVMVDPKSKGVGDGAWAWSAIQDYRGNDVSKSQFGPEWYGRKIGVTIRMLPAQETTLLVGQPPNGNKPMGEMPGLVLAARRTAVDTTYAALHEPFEGGKGKIDAYERIAEAAEGVAARIAAGRAFDDRVLVAFGDSQDKAVTLAGSGESFTFTNYGHIRIAGDTVTVSGPVTALTIKAPNAGKLIVNGKAYPAAVNNSTGMLVWKP